MEHSVALITGGPSGVGYAAARALAEEGWRQIIITGRSLAEAQEAAAKLAAETKRQVFTPLELELDTLSSVQSVLAELVKRGRPVDLLLLNAGIMGTKGTQAHCGGHRGIDGSADRPSSTDRRASPRQPAEPRCADCHRQLGSCPGGRT